MNANLSLPTRVPRSRFTERPFRCLTLLANVLLLNVGGLPISPLMAADPGNIIVLDETGVKNLRIETVEVEETAFEATIFSLGRIEVIPAATSPP